ncbi:MAG: OmpH family outer membrane protein [Ignavibacteria bacterium]|nr:OmpH family outer membrane protein [Ignavibacteria bacterium]
MKLKISLIAIFALTLLLHLNSNAQNLKIGYVDSDIIIKQLPEYKTITAELEQLQKKYLDTIQARENEIKTKAQEFKTKYEDAQKKVESGEIKSDAEIKALNEEMTVLQNELRELDDSLTTYKQNVREILINKSNELFKPVKEKVIKAIEDIAKELKYNFVFDKADGVLLFGDKEYDLTFKVLDKLK